MENLQNIYEKIWQKKVPQLLFYAGFTIELFMVIIDKSNYINPIEGWLFRITFLLFALKLVFTEYNRKEWCLIVFMEVIGVISYKVTGKNDVIRIVTFVAACKGIPLRQMIRYAFYVTLAGCVAIIFLSVTGIYGEMSLTADYGREYEVLSRQGIVETRYTLGMGHPNSLSCMYLMLCAMGIYVYAEKMKWYFYLFLMLLNVGIYKLTDSKTSMLITSLLLCGSFVMTYCRFLREKKFAYLCGAFVFLFCVAFSVDAAACAVRVEDAQWRETYMGNPKVQLNPEDVPPNNHIVALLRINQHINGRITSLADSEKNDGALENWRAFSNPNNMNYYFDMGWVKLFYRYGIVPGILYCIACIVLLWQFMQKKDAFGLVIFTVLAIYSVVEAHLFSVYIGRNFLLMMMGSCFFDTYKTDVRRQDIA